MSSNAITRRRLLATGMSSTAALALGSFLASSAALAQEPTQIVTFYDPRFPRSRQLAGALPDASRLRAVRGDPSQLLAQLAPGAMVARGTRWQGVTTETIPFCLELTARRHHDVHLESRRLDRDLFAWALSMPIRPSTA
jgi:hypothetical protein